MQLQHLKCHRSCGMESFACRLHRGTVFSEVEFRQKLLLQLNHKTGDEALSIKVVSIGLLAEAVVVNTILIRMEGNLT